MSPAPLVPEHCHPLIYRIYRIARIITRACLIIKFPGPKKKQEEESTCQYTHLSYMRDIDLKEKGRDHRPLPRTGPPFQLQPARSRPTRLSDTGFRVAVFGFLSSAVQEVSVLKVKTNKVTV